MILTYKESKEYRLLLEKECQKYSDILKEKWGSCPRNSMNIPIDSVLQNSEYKEDKLNYQRAFNNLRDYNKKFVKQFKREIREERKVK